VEAICAALREAVNDKPDSRMLVMKDLFWNHCVVSEALELDHESHLTVARANTINEVRAVKRTRKLNCSLIEMRIFLNVKIRFPHRTVTIYVDRCDLKAYNCQRSSPQPYLHCNNVVVSSDCLHRRVDLRRFWQSIDSIT
jgi:hypothetical protein